MRLFCWPVFRPVLHISVLLSLPAMKFSEYFE